MPRHLTAEEAHAQLAALAERSPFVAGLDAHQPEFVRWKRDCESVIERRYGTRANVLKDFRSFDFEGRFVMPEWGEGSRQEALVKNVGKAQAFLESLRQEAFDEWQSELRRRATAEDSALSARMKPSGRKVFVVHGRDEGAKEEVARFLSKLGLEPIVLHEQPNKGRTIIEKFEKYSDVGFAVVILTPDDIGGLQSEQRDLKPRARQNVVFEFGYFIGKLGRDRVCGLHRGKIDLPSDYSGVLYVPFDAQGAWRLLLVRELKAAKLDVDANKAV